MDLPDDFPKDQFLNIARALTKLPDGSQEGCYEHLEHAEEYLPEIRDLHFPSEELVVSGSKAALQRGGAIDRALESLMASVPTALARYRRIARIKPPKKKPEAAIEAAIALPERMRAEPIANATRLERELSAARVEVEAMTEPHSKPAEDLKRQITDGIELSRLARILLSMKELVVSRYGRVVDALKDYPDLLQRSFSAIRVGIDVAENLADSWVKFEHTMIHLLFDAFRQAVAILEEAAVEASLLSNGARTFNINEARRLIMRGKAPPDSWVTLITRLDFTGRKLTNLEPLTGLHALKGLNLKLTQVSDLSPLAKLTALEWLDLGRTEVTDISALGALTNLRYLDLWNTNIEDVTPLANLCSLRSLSLGATRVSDVSPLAGLENLERLDLRGTRVADVAPLDYLSELQSLILSQTLVKDVTPLAGLINLQRLYLSDTGVTSIASLTHLKKLQSVHLCGTAVSDLSPLRGISDLRTVELHGTSVSKASMAELRDGVGGLSIERADPSSPDPP